MKLTRQQLKGHERAVELIHAHPPGTHWNRTIECGCGGTCDDCDSDGTVNVAHYIFNHFQPGYCRDISRAANFFTPRQDALAVAQAGGARGRVLEPSAGIGAIAHAVFTQNSWDERDRSHLKLTCVELVEEFVALGKLMVPAATWICGNIFDVLPTLGEFDCFAGNPPFGNIPSNQSKVWGNDIAFGMIQELLPQCHSGGTFILPEGHNSSGWRSGDFFGRGEPSSKALRFKKLNPAWLISPTSFGLSNAWHGTGVTCEIVNIERDDRYEPEAPEHVASIDSPATTTAARVLVEYANAFGSL